MKEVFVVEEYEWYSGGSGISIYETGELAMAAIAELTKRREWKRIFCPDPGALIEYQSQHNSKSIVLWKLPINPTSLSAASEEK